MTNSASQLSHTCKVFIIQFHMNLLYKLILVMQLYYLPVHILLVDSNQHFLASPSKVFHIILYRNPDMVLADKYDQSVVEMTHLTSHQNVYTQMHLPLAIHRHVPYRSR